MRQNKFESEAELAKHIVATLRASGWDVYQEVTLGACVADILAVWNNRIVWVIETKLSLNLTVLAQAWGWRPYAHYISVGVPIYALKAKTTDLALKILTDNGIGCLTVSQGAYSFNPSVGTLVDCRLFRKARAAKFLGTLCPELRDYKQAGSTEGHCYTPFRATCDKLIKVVQQHPLGITLPEAMSQVKHHYSSEAVARRCIGDLCKQGYFKKDFTHEPDGRSIRLRPLEAKNG